MSQSPEAKKGGLARTLAVARVQWKLALRPPPELGGHDKVVLGALLIPLLAFVALALGFLGYMAGSKLSAEPLYFHGLLVGFATFLLVVTGFSVPFADKSLSGFEIGRLFHLPIRPGEILASQVLGNALNPGVVLIPGAFILGCVAGSLRAGLFSLAVRCLLAGLLWLTQLGLLIIAADYALLCVRRLKLLRRIGVFLAILLCVGAVWLLRAFGTAAESESVASAPAPLKQLLKSAWDTWESIAGFLPGISPTAWVTLRHGWWAVLLVSLVEIALLFAAGSWLLDAIMGGRIAAEASGAGKARRASKARGAAVLEGLPFWPFFSKDLRLLVREKNIWITIFGVGVLMAVIPQMALELAGDDPGRFGALSGTITNWVGPICALAVVFLLGSFSLNQIGLEGPAVQLFLASPAPRWRYLAGKNLALFFMAAGILACAEVGLLVRHARWTTILADCVFFAALQAAYLAAGNVASVLWPYPASISGKATGAKASQVTILLTSLYQFFLILLFGYVALPLLSGRLAMALQGAVGWDYWAVGTCMLLYGGIFYGLGLYGASQLLQKLEPQLLEKLVRP